MLFSFSQDMDRDDFLVPSVLSPKNLTATQSPYRMHAGAAISSFRKHKYSGRFPRVKTIQPNQT